MNCVPQIHVLTDWPLVPKNVTLFGNGVVASVTGLGEVILDWGGP